MSSPSSVAAVNPTTELAALAAHLQTIADASVKAHALLTNVLLGYSFVRVPSFVAGTPITPSQLAAVTPVDEEVQHYWVVLRGLEPGLYRTDAAATAQTKGVPRSFQQRKAGRDEALAFYAANYPSSVNKWVAVPAPVPEAPADEAPVAAHSLA
ncbi:hypothetical protein C8R44DRAFT_740066 [Mycena epipterygia]|nr:hypothetical protein C8R44DRAFT_886655 [Mycena epipterygia]KAJ7114688.1 hypothetical protein C8R44DRAFT_740066 [Mycena epipterygia]